MHHAPPVLVLAKKSRWHLGVIVALALVAVLVQITLVAQTAQMTTANVLIFSATVFTTAWALSKWKHSPATALRWDGNGWFLKTATDDLRVDMFVCMDWQHCLLLRATQPNHHSTWLWFDRSVNSQQWCALRRAVWSSERMRGTKQALI